MRLSTKGKGGAPPRSVWFEIGFWKTPNRIHIATNDSEAEKFHVTVSEDPTKRDGNPKLYRLLNSYLKQKGAAEPQSRRETITSPRQQST